MSANLIGVMIILGMMLALVAAVGIGIYVIYRKIHRTVSSYSQTLFGTTDPLEGMRRIEMQQVNNPKSVSGATDLYLPQIMRDFPEFHYDEIKVRAENLLTSYLRCIDGANLSLLTEGMEELKEGLRMRLQMLQNRDSREHFQRIAVHQTEINQYRKEKGRCSIVLQSSVEYIHYIEKGGKIVQGKQDVKEQARYNIELVYIQDRDVVVHSGDAGLGLNCPNCGAPLPGLGAKKCVYCDTPVVEFNLRVWNFSAVKEV